jgi:hypothetical protein
MISPTYLLGFVMLATFLSSAVAVDKYQETCTPASNVTKETAPGVSTTTITHDSCDTAKFLACKEGRCLCADPRNQLYTSREVEVSSRSRRSPGKGGKGGKSKSKGVGTGTAVVGGLAAGVVGYEIGKAVSHNDGGHSRGDSGSTSGGSYSNSRKTKTKVEYGCFSRVSGDCVIDKTRVVQVENATTVVGADGNKTVTITKHTVDYSGYTACISHAECKPKKVQVVGADSNIGECVCKDGYQKTTTDICVKTNSAQQLMASTGILSVIFLHFVVSKISA